MVARVSAWLRRRSSTGVALAALVVFLLFSAVVLPRQAAQADQAAGGVGSPDTSLWYSAADLYAMAEAYGEQGRAAYVRARFTFDLIWPVVYTLFLTTAIGWLFSRGVAAGSRWQWANLLPLVAMLLDYLENLSTSVVMLRYPAQTAVIGHLVPLFTLSKWACVGGSGLLLVAGLVAAARKWVRDRR